ncbi:unnamed protein product, partial [marine sediment metagenome]
YVKFCPRIGDTYIDDIPTLSTRFGIKGIRVVAGMATFPLRESVAKRTVLSIIDQVDELGIYLNNYNHVPSYMRHPKIRVFRDFEEKGDLNDVGKFYMLKYQKIQDGYYISIDDDILYPPNYVNMLICKSQQYQDKAIVGVHGTFYPNEFTRVFQKDRTVLSYKFELLTDTQVAFLGTGTMLYPLQLLGDVDFKYLFDSQGMHGKLDIYMAWYAKHFKIVNICIARKKAWMQDIHTPKTATHTLWNRFKNDDKTHTATFEREKVYEL